MNPRPGIAFVLVALTVWMMPSADVRACACCADTGHYHSGYADLDEYPLSQLKRVRFGRTASLFVNDAGLEENSVGITKPQLSYPVQGSMAEKTMTLTLGAGRGSGKLVLQLPAKMWDHSADIHDGKLSGGGGPLLYKEWRFEGDVAGTGIFQPGFTSPAKYVLVLQGRGNACDNAEDFTYWRLDVKGNAADYAFHGRLGKPATAPAGK